MITLNRSLSAVLGLSALWLMENSLALTVTGSVGSNISVACRYLETYQNNSKFFCQMNDSFAQRDPQCVQTTRRETSIIANWMGAEPYYLQHLWPAACAGGTPLGPTSRNLLLVVLEFVFVQDVVSLNPVTAPVGGNATFRCSHFLASGNIKYFCRNSCEDEFILIRSNKKQNPTRTDRFTLYDEGSDFTVTITRLQLSDSGTYICAVDRLFKDTYEHVTLHVFKVFTSTPVSASRPPARTTTRNAAENNERSVTMQSSADTSPETMHGSALSGPLFYVGVGLGVLALIFTVIFIFIQLKYKQKRCSSSVTASTHQPDSLNHSTLNITAQSDSLNYSSVLFIRKHNCTVKNSETFEMNLNETLYSSVQTPLQSNITDPNSLIYSRVTKGL
ncbi:CMRF35-like molecule 8 [Chanodichthys erythropterus]|uniref:CMRF35-like molecule 8 n=1 Tax=Chanodichthys erythropterus TaxID=933992 RepID=UPI00351E0E5F